MYQIQKTKFLFFAALTLPVLVFFQNCEKSGSFSKSDETQIQSMNQSSTAGLHVVPETPDQLVVDAADLNEVASNNVGETVPTEPTGSVVPEIPLNSDPGPIVAEPPAPEPEGAPVTPVTPIVSSPVDQPPPAVDEPPVVIAEPTLPVVVTEVPHDDHSCGRRDRHGHRSKKTGKLISLTPAHQESEAKSSAQKCASLNVADILLSVKSCGDFEILEKNSEISLNKLTLKVKALKSSKFKQLLLQLSANGNKVLSFSNQILQLQNKNGKAIDLKVNLDLESSVKANKVYTLHFQVSFEKQLTEAARCSVKPLLQASLRGT